MMKISFGLASWVWVFGILSAQTLLASEARVETSYGVLPVQVDRPEGKGPFPALLIAPAKKYLMKERLFEQLAAEAVKAGFLVARFNWSFTLLGEEPSEGFVREASEIDAILKYFRGRRDVRRDQIILAAKSMGSQAAMRASLSPFKGVLLLTPNCDDKNTFRKIYSRLFEGLTQVQITISTEDPYCDVKQIYGAAEDLSKVLSLHTLRGDHNFVTDGENPYANQDAAIQSSVNWLKNQARESAI